ncbi:DUF222 domain-containing protein [Nocardioides seonyuensis]|uniref:DUF222 domain-containing protein n=1 Tax=Nocardioides seonyuensis TaxID=2518371 RepID=A0A4P7IGP7_9ACTN|nr:DUF222 domain-containing protein [Nocardioides seonyuensis]
MCDDPRVLHALSVGAWRSAVSVALESPSGLDDAARVDAIRALEEAACVISAAQAALARELDASQRAAQAEAGVPAARRGLGVAKQVGLARRVSHDRGARHLGLARIVASELPCTWAAWRAGRIGEWKATVIARETACLSLEHRLEVDRLIAGDPVRVEGMGDRELAGLCAAHAARLDASSVTARRRRAESERRVTCRPAPDTMTHVSALLPVKDGVAVHAVLTRAAVRARAAGDERTQGQVMADTLVAAVLAHEQRHQTTQAPAPGEPRAASSTRVNLNVVMSDAALFGTSEDPAHLVGFGPIPAELAREIIAGACAQGEELWLRRLYAHPHTGELASMDTRGRFFRGNLARFIRLRDQTCRTPWCDAPIRHVDHAHPDSTGGPTSDANGQGLCEACNHAKEAPGWRARPGPEGTITTTTPTGHRHTSRPPPVATIRRTDLPPLRVDYILAG